MNSNSIVIKFLEKKGYHPKTNYYSYIENWRLWYENNVNNFHKYHDHNGTERELYKLGMAKRVCEDWSSILFTERDVLNCDNKNNQNYLKTKLEELMFNDEIPDNIETGFWSGAVATITRVYNAIIKDGQLEADETTGYDLINVSADQIVPLKIIHKKIVDIAFVSKDQIEDKDLYYIEIHELKEKGYTIFNYYIDEEGNEVDVKGVAKEYSTGSKIPLFNILGPKIVNNIRKNNGLGISVYGNAIDQLKMCDISYNNFVKDVDLGGKKIIYNKKLVRYETTVYKDKKTGEETIKEVPIYPDDLTRQQFQIAGDDLENVNDKPLIHEYNPDLRIEDNEKAINFSLNLLSFKCGLGKGYYKFENGTVVTATQYLGENKDLVGNAKKHRKALNEYTVGIARSILLLGRILFGVNTDEKDNIVLTDLDGFLVSDEEKQEQYRQDFSMGVMSKTSYLMKARGMSEEQAKEELEKVKKENPTVKDLVGE